MQDAYVISPFTGYSRIGKRPQFLISFLSITLVSGLCFLFSGYIGAQVVAFVLLLTLSLIAMFFDILPVLLSAVLSALIWDYFFLLPRYNLRVGDTEDKILLSMYFVIALINAVLTFKIRQIEKIAREKEEKAKTLKFYNTLLNSLSHQFRTPLATIIGATDNLLEKPSRLTEEDSIKLLSEISIASLRLNRQVENLLNMSRLESGIIQAKKDCHDLRELLRSVVAQLKEQLAFRAVLIDIPEAFPLLKMDYGLMEQVFYNLVYNAALYTPENSLIRIGADSEPERLTIVVEDDGPGFPEEEMDKVFDKFYRLKNPRPGGSGIGLSIVRGFLEAHNGSVELMNRSSGGARFMIHLPADMAMNLPVTGPGENSILKLSAS